MLTKEVNILEVNKSCFKDCFYSFSHEHTCLHFLSFTSFTPHKVPPHPPQTPQSSIVSVEHCLSFDCFRFPSFDFRFDLFFFGFESPPPVHSYTPHPLFLFNLTPFYIVLFFSSFFYLSLSLCSKRTVPLHRRSLTCAVETYQFSPGSGREEEHHLNIFCLFLTGSLSVCVCARAQRKRWNNSRNGRGRFFKYGIKRSRRE